MIQISRDNIAGEYFGTTQGTELTLRIDVGQADSLDIISGDMRFDESLDHLNHSFQTAFLTSESTANGQLLRGMVKIHSDRLVPDARLDLAVPDQGDLNATYTLYAFQGSSRQATPFAFQLSRRSAFHRRVELEVEQVVGVPLPQPFQTNLHPHTPGNLQPRPLTFEAAYADAGIELDVTLGGEDVPVSESGIDALWSSEELEAAMANHFDARKNVEQWRLYLLLATKYRDPRVLGIMFDSADDFPRQGTAIFYSHPAIQNASDLDRNREYLYTIVHELGHAFNMLHSFQKGAMQTHGVLPRPQALSWMNYPHFFPFGLAYPEGWNGTSSFWSQFRFTFELEELAHLRHNDSSEVIMGGHSFGFAGHLEERPFSRPSNEADVSCVLWVPPSVEFMELIEGDVRLRNESHTLVRVQPSLDPTAGYVELLIKRPNDRYPRVFRHFARTCSGFELQDLAPGEAVYQEISPSFGSRRWHVDEPGTYEIQAQYHSPDGRKLASEVRRVRVLLPVGDAERLAPDYFTTDVGRYLGLEGSRSPQMRHAYEELMEVSQRIPKSQAARQIEIVNAFRDVRVFKDVRNRTVVRPTDRVKATNNLLKALDVTKSRESVKTAPSQGHLRLSRLLENAAIYFDSANDRQNVEVVLGTMENFLTTVNAPAQARNELATFSQHLR